MDTDTLGGNRIVTNVSFFSILSHSKEKVITIRVILLVYGLAGALSVSILLSVELVLSHVVLCRSCKTGDTTIG